MSLTTMYHYSLSTLCLLVLGLAIQSVMCVLCPWTQSWKLGLVHSCNTIKGIFLYSTTIVQLTMDYLLKAVEDGVVDSPLNCGVFVAMNLPSPLRRKAMVKSSKSNFRESNGVQHNLYLELSPAPNRKSLMVQLLYYLPSS